MAGYSPLEDFNRNCSPPTSPLANPALQRLSLPNSAERRRSSLSFVNRIVLCAIDPSSHSKDAFEWYIRNVWNKDDLIVLVYCPESPNFPTFSFKKGLTPPVDTWKDIIDEMNTKTRKLEEEYEGLCVEKRLRYKVRWESYKNPGEGICKIAEEEKADLIVVGSRGMGALKRALMGSCSEYVVRNSGLPVIVIPGEK